MKISERKMNVKVTTFRNPFSFFCISEDALTNIQNVELPESNGGLPISNKFDLSGVNHGQYVAVLWNNNWARGIITLETQFLIWLVDYGIYLRPNEHTVYVNLPPEDKKYATKVFEASVHGVTPVEKILNDMCEIEDATSTTWSSGAIEKAQELLAEATKIYFVPIAILSTKINDVVIGDLYLRIKGRGIVTLVDELETWPVFLEKDPEIYIEKMAKFYTYRRQHRASLKKPVFPDIALPTISLQLRLDDYTAICENAPQFDISDCNESDEEGSTVTYIESVCQTKNAFKLTPAEIEKYSNVYITVSGIEYNVLHVLLNKARDLYMCEKFKDLKSIGRATSRSSKFKNCEDDE